MWLEMVHNDTICPVTVRCDQLWPHFSIANPDQFSKRAPEITTYDL